MEGVKGNTNSPIVFFDLKALGGKAHVPDLDTGLLSCCYF